ncbi:hypothetical protein [Aquimarina algiphila]|uniref:hypothetical protein n=1 Tax=Aquimarina algiphila TaxID=2047982 RepID=UPI00232F0107|nr:hypothetical protein [Aquimarina algiphila]
MKNIGIQVIDHNDNGTLLDIKIDVVRNSSGKIEHGLVVNDTLQQNKAFLLMAHQGELKATPQLGVGFSDILLGTDLLEYRHKIREQFPIDGLQISKLTLYNNKPFEIEADYEK